MPRRNRRADLRRRVRHAALSLLALAASCGGPTVFLRRPEPPLQWPPAPEPSRIELQLAYHGAQDVERHPGFWASFRDLLAGADPTELLSPVGIAWSPPDLLWIADPGLGAVHRLDLASGEHLVLRGTEEEPLGTPVGVACNQESVFVSDSTRGRILQFGTDGTLVRAFGTHEELGRPTGIAWDPKKGRLLLLDTPGCRLLALSPEGIVQQRIGERGDRPGQFNYPTTLAVAPDGRVFVLDSLNFRVQILDPDFAPLAEFGQVGRGPGSFAMPKGIALDADGHIYVVDAMFENVQIFEPTGELLLAFGGHGKGLGAMALPSGICIDAQSRVHVADAGNSRIQTFRYVRRP